MERISAIYEIICNATDAHYVGKSVNVFSRWKRHKEDLRTGKHHSAYLQRAFNKYGEDSFEFVIIEKVKPELLSERELFYLANNAGKFNMMLSFNGGVLQHSKDTRKKMTEGQLRNWERKRASGMICLSDKHRAAISKAHFGKKASIETTHNVGVLPMAGQLKNVCRNKCTVNKQKV